VYACWKCEKPLEIIGRVGRQDLCPHCRAAMHACKNCKYWDVGAHNQCREPQAAYVPDREGGNFCDYFDFKPATAKDDSAAARARLEAAFSSESAKGKKVVTPPSNDPRARLDRMFGGSGAPSKSKVVQNEGDAKKGLDDLFKKK
jgi:hypothetical protein